MAPRRDFGRELITDSGLPEKRRNISNDSPTVAAPLPFGFLFRQIRIYVVDYDDKERQCRSGETDSNDKNTSPAKSVREIIITKHEYKLAYQYPAQTQENRDTPSDVITHKLSIGWIRNIWRQSCNRLPSHNSPIFAPSSTARPAYFHLGCTIGFVSLGGLMESQVRLF